MADLIQVNKEAQKKLLDMAKAVVQKRAMFTEMHNKMEVIDQAYARHNMNSNLPQGLDSTGYDPSAAERAGETCCGDVFTSDNVTPPIVVSQVDAMVAYLADIFLSGYPLFPVVSNPKDMKDAEKLEVLLDDHAQLGGYVRQLLMMLRDGCKYNIAALECAWDSIDQFSTANDFTNTKTGKKTEVKNNFFNKIKRLDMYNTVWDIDVAPGDVAAEGDYAGYFELISKTKLKRLMNKLTTQNKALNTTGNFNGMAASFSSSMKEHPTVSAYVSPRKTRGHDWGVYMGETPEKRSRTLDNLIDGSVFEKLTLYVRIMPADYKIMAPASKTPQIWKLVIINMETIIQAERIISAYDFLPILMSQPLEDGLGYQTQSIAEGAIPFQEAASKLFNIRFAAARRAVSDRALYNSTLINPKDVNSKAPAAKIPVRLSTLSSLGLDQAYKSIPFDMRGTETVLSDAQQIVGFSQQLSGINGPMGGQFQKGNKSVQEWNDTMGGSDNRLRLPALLLECQLFTPLKHIMVLNIYQYGENVQIVSQKTGEVLDININELRAKVLSFKLADGYSPKSKIASVEVLTMGFNLIMNAPLLQQQFGASLPLMFTHMMSLGGVKGLEQYAPQLSTQGAPSGIGATTEPALLADGTANPAVQSAPPGALVG
jgi:hypothetical protein